MPDLKKGVDSSSLVSLMYSLYLQMRTGVGKSRHGTTLIILTQAPLLLANSHQHNGCPIFLVNLTLFFVLGCSFNCQFTDCINVYLQGENGGQTRHHAFCFQPKRIWQITSPESPAIKTHLPHNFDWWIYLSSFLRGNLNRDMECIKFVKEGLEHLQS